MMHWMRSQMSKDEGFTLVELMVVVLIIAILIAIAIPTFLGARRGAQDRAAQSQIRNALVAEKAFYVDNEGYTNALAPDLTNLEPNLDTTIVATSVGAAKANGFFSGVCLSLVSESTTTFYLYEDETNGTFYGSSDDGVAACPGALGAPAAPWTSDGW